MRCILFVLVIGLSMTGQAGDKPTNQTNKEFSRWVEAFKLSAKGPFNQIRWYCKDGTVLPPQAGACAKHGGGIQHGQWNEQTRKLRASGYYIGNVLAAVETDAVIGTAGQRQALKQILLERYLMAADDGWIFRGARYYRGAMQIEDEVVGARRLLIALSQAQQNRPRDFLLLRVAARLLPHGEESTDVARVRQLSTQLGERDAGFEKLRNKIHSQPDIGDAARVRDYAAEHVARNLAQDYLQLADAIDAVYRPGQVDSTLAALVRSLPRRLIADKFRRGRHAFKQDPAPAERLHLAARLLAVLRDEFPYLTSPVQWLDTLDVSLALEREVFTAGAALREGLGKQSRRQRIVLLKDVAMALYGSGEISSRQWQSVSDVLEQLLRDNISLSEYRQHLRYLSRLPGWIDRAYQFHFAETVAHLAAIEAKTSRFIPDQLRGGAALFGSALLDGLSIDADRLAQVSHSLFGKPVGSGLRMLNPGLARGTLHTDTDANSQTLQADGIYVLPETMPELPPVTGILTLGEGNMLSHIQLLARNLGIPNVVIDDRVHSVLRHDDGSKVVMAVSPGGRVLLERDGPKWERIFGSAGPLAHERIDANVQKLDLQVRDLFGLGQLRATDAGRIAGPKAANLGELRYQFPGNVPSGVVIPFGVFYALLQQPGKETGQTLFEWMQAEYRRMDSLVGEPQQQARHRFLKTLRERILHSDPGVEFRTQLREALHRHLGEEDNYTLFVRSDTNMEDLPGFTGAGLNLTVPNVKGFDALLDAIRQVWASPFTERAFNWRQRRMQQPEHVYVSVLLMPSVAVDKSGVMVTADVAADKPGWITVAMNEGVGGAVQGQAAEELRINVASGQVQLLAEASSPVRRVLNAQGGLDSLPVSASEEVLSAEEIRQLRDLARELPRRFPMQDEQGQAAAIDVEFGYYADKLILFQARPYLASRSAQKNQYLKDLDAGLHDSGQQRIVLDDVPAE
ncbi:PEP/pyruvate-binding domain-containing protein [Sulfuriflexus mobilis]|uniref:PEP/pyruvate-binding domain-containing protein n=1 Tax=Sulfuriflexus mobilis TaxID=1811807 RepID=UPI000F847FD6|nr:PEP/pyruvate-binding domain-containing protein [Sulfuriflexus mobilis]